MNEEVEVGDGQFLIPEQNWKKFQAAIAKLSRKAEKLVGETINPVVFGYEMKDVGNGQQVKMFNVLLGGPKVGIAGWSFLALLDHSNKEVGNIVRTVPGKTLPQRFYTSTSACDHCNVNRFRRDTYVIENDTTGEVKQVGSTCLKDFLQHDSADRIAKLAELMGYAAECARGFRDTVGEDRRYVDLELYLQFVASDIRNHGRFVSRSEAYNTGFPSTANRAMNNLHAHSAVDMINDSDRALAADAARWAQSLGEDGRTLNDYTHNIKVIAASGFIEHRSIGFAASIVSSFLRSQQRVVISQPSASKFLGQEGDKLLLNVEITALREIETQYGFSWLHTAVTDQGDVVKTFASKKLASVGDRGVLKGTVKKHETYNKIDGTILTRCKFEA